MSVISLAVLFVFGFSEMAMLGTPQQHDGCGGSQQVAISNGWAGDASLRQVLSNPAFPPSPPSHLPVPAGCTRSGMMAIG
jgi:hypothetical protein